MSSLSISQLRNQVFTAWKWCLSFRRRSWELSDYPIEIRKQAPDPDLNYTSPRFTLHRYRAYIVNWAVVSGGGETVDEALQSLRTQFETMNSNRRGEGKSQPRPGVAVPIEFASRELIDRNFDLSEDFIERVLNLEWAWISDDSSLADFHTEQDNRAFVSKIREIYGVDISDIESAKLPEILNRIAGRREPRPTV
jgi:hypothetical protein